METNNAMKLETERLRMRPVTIEDKSAIFEYRSDSETNKYQGSIPNSLSDVEAFINKLAKHINEPSSWFQLVIIERASEEIIGDLGIHFFGSENKQTEIGCTLNKIYHHRGYATEAVRSVIDYLFHDLNKHRIIASIDPANESSIKLVERLGFRKEAHFVKSLFINGQWVDDIVYALLKDDW
ncbi:MAG: GNAT family protein [Salinivirgaceae bacterium]|jgi:RimJ/RimL family protein N-acetyltransferase|nr:GNAT family protein [Salinivirgaceae bacterium]